MSTFNSLPGCTNNKLQKIQNFAARLLSIVYSLEWLASVTIVTKRSHVTPVFSTLSVCLITTCDTSWLHLCPPSQPVYIINKFVVCRPSGHLSSRKSTMSFTCQQLTPDVWQVTLLSGPKLLLIRILQQVQKGVTVFLVSEMPLQ